MTESNTASAPTDGALTIRRVGTRTILVPIVGVTPLIVHRFSEKAKRQMLDNMQGIKKVKEPKDPERDFKSALYPMDDEGYGFPALGFKAATVSAARYFDKSVTMVGLRQALFIKGEWSKAVGQSLIRIEGSEPEMREDVVTVGVSGSDLRYRPQFTEWSATLPVTYVSSMLTEDSVISLIEAGGMGVGVGEWRMERKGESGSYTIDTSRNILDITEIAAKRALA